MPPRAYSQLQQQLEELVKQMAKEHDRVRGEHERVRAELDKEHVGSKTQSSQARQQVNADAADESEQPDKAEQLPEGFTSPADEVADSPGASEEEEEEEDEESDSDEEDDDEEDSSKVPQKVRQQSTSSPPPLVRRPSKEPRKSPPPGPAFKDDDGEEDVDDLIGSEADGPQNSDSDSDNSFKVVQKPKPKKKGVGFASEENTEVIEVTGRGTTHGKVKLTLKQVWQTATKLDIKEIRRDSHIGQITLTSDDTQNNTTCARISRRLVTHPSSKLRVAFDFLGMFFLSYDLVMVPLSAFGEYITSESFWVKDVGFVSSLYWAGDMFSTFFLGFHTKGMVELNMLKIGMRYLKTWFVMDFLLVTLDFAFIIMGLGQNASALRIGKTLSRGARVLRLLRIVKMHNIISNLLESIQSEYIRTFISIIGIMVAIVLANHFIACGWYLISFWESTNWRDAFFTEQEHEEFGYRYATSLHWSLTQFTPASMEVHPKNMTERFYSVVILLFAMVAFSSFISSITQAMTHLREMNGKASEEEALLRRYLNQHGISGKMVNRVWHYLHQREVLNFGRVRTKAYEVKSLSRLPKSMRVELALESFGPQLKKHPMFYHFSFHNLSAFRQLCFDCLQEYSLLTRQELFTDDDEVCMFFVLEGLLEYALPCECAEVPQEILEMEKKEIDVSDIGQEGEEVPQKKPASAKNKLVRSFTTKMAETMKNKMTMPIEAGAAAILGARWADRIKEGEWACEAALWAKEVKLSGPFTALVQSEVITIKTGAFLTLMEKHEYSKVKVAQYGQSFVEYMEYMSNCRWRTVIANDHSTIEDLVHRVFDYTNSGTAEEVQQRKTRTIRATHALSEEEPAWRSRSANDGRLSRLTKGIGKRISSLLPGGASNRRRSEAHRAAILGNEDSVLPNGRTNGEADDSQYSQASGSRRSRVQPMEDDDSEKSETEN